MQEIVPPKLNKDTGLFSLIINRKNIISVIGIGLSIFIWSSSPSISTDRKIILEIVLALLLIPFAIDRYGRPLYQILIDGIKFITAKKEQKVFLCNDICEGIIVNPNNQYSKVYQIEPINLSMSSEEEIMSFKRHMQQALFGLTETVQIITVQNFSNYDENFSTELERESKLTGKLKKCCKNYLSEYQQLNQTIERSFYLITTTTANKLESAQKRLDDQENSFGRLLEQTKVKLIPLNSTEILNLSESLIRS